MSFDAAERNLRQAQRSVGEPEFDVESFGEDKTEHISIGDDGNDQICEPTTVIKHKRIRNRVRDTVTGLTFYDEGFLKIREESGKKLRIEHFLELRFIHADPVTMRRFDATCLRSSLCFGIMALVVLFVLPLTNFATYTISSTLILATLTVLSLLLFVYRSEVTYQFFTTSGRTNVLSLTGSFGCHNRMGALVREVSQAIVEAGAETDAHNVRYLRAEMQAHYDLAEIGVITREACSNGTTLILSKFG